MTPIWWLLAFFPALVSLYFLKLKRRDVVVSSTLLWKRSLEDLRVNAPFQRLRKNWLLLLQLLVLAGLIGAAWRPRISSELTGGRIFIALVDNSASMSARERDGTRLDLARRGALALVSTLAASDRMALLAFSSRTEVLEPLTSDKGALEAAIRSIQPGAMPTDLEQALLVAHSMAEALPDAEVRVFGDGCYGDLSSLPPEAKRMKMQVTSVGTPLENAGITELDVRRTFEGKARTELFALIENAGKEPAHLTVSLGLNDALKDAREIEVPPGGSQPVLFDATIAGSGIAKVTIDSKDALPVDDEAWIRVDPPRVVRVLVTGKPNPWLDLVLESTSRLSHRRVSESDYAKLVAASSAEELGAKLGADVLIFDRASLTPPDGAEAKPPSGPPLPALYIDCLPPPGDALVEREKRKQPVVIDWDRTHPVNRFLSFTDLFIEESFVFRPGREYRSLVDSEAGSIIGTLRYYPPGRRPIPVIVVGFDILASNWPLGHYSFPIFFANALSWLGGGEGETGRARARTGEALIIDSLPGGGLAPADVRLRSPSGRELKPSLETGGTYALGSADEVGIYDVLVDGAPGERIPVSLLNAAESRLTAAGSVSFGDFNVEVKASSERGASDLWKWFLLAALLFCCLEWQVYNRRLAA